MTDQFIVPDWPAPAKIKSLLTTRVGGFSPSPFDSFNLAQHVADQVAYVQKNRQQLRRQLPSEPLWLNQIHSKVVVDASQSQSGVDADGSYTSESNCVSLVMTADCLPLLICNQQATVVAAVHAGWRGLLDGIIEQAIAKVLVAGQCQPEDLLIYLGPAIGPKKFAVGTEVRQAYIEACIEKLQDISKTKKCFAALGDNKYLADIYQLAKLRLGYLGVESIYGGNYCTYSEQDSFFSYRRDGKTGRMASMIWITE